MNKDMKQHLETVVMSIVNEDVSTAKKSFHEYLRLKTQSILSEKEECDTEDDGTEEEGSGDEEEGSGKPKPFTKKSKKDDKKDEE